MEDKDKEEFILLAQTKYLEEQLERYHLRCDHLEKQNSDLLWLCRTLQQDALDISEYLKRSAADKRQQLEELEEQLQELEEHLKQQPLEAEQDLKELKLQHGREEQQLQEQILHLDEENRKQALVLEQQEEQLKEQVELTERMKRETVTLEEKLVQQEEVYRAAVERLQKEAEEKSQKLMEEKRQLTKELAKSRTRLVLEEEAKRHRKLLEPFQALVSALDKLLKKKSSLELADEQLRCQVDFRRTTLSRRNQKASNSRKEVEQWKQRETELKERWSSSIERLQELVTSVRLRLDSVLDRYNQETVKLSQLGAELHRERGSRRQLEGAVEPAVAALRRILEQDSENVSGTQMERLLEILEKTAAGTEPASTPPQQTSVPESNSVETQNITTEPVFLMARYRLGDLGLVPRPTWKHKPVPSSTSLNRRVLENVTTGSSPVPQDGSS